MILRGVPYGPVALSCVGDLSLLTRPAVAIVGARACTPYGRDWAARLARSVAHAGGVVVSGLAAGIDQAAHAAAGGATIAVLGQGIDQSMPAWQRRARATILEQGGLVVSEMPPMAHASVYSFPIRNRIIAGLATAVAVIEAGARSGARNTASHALRYGRDVLALPGPLGATASVGCLDLIEQGATVIRGVHTLLEVAGLPFASAVSTAANPGPTGQGAGAPAAGEGAIVGLLRLDPSTPEQLVAETGLPHARVMELVGMLELTGRVVRLPGRRYQLRST